MKSYTLTEQELSYLIERAVATRNMIHAAQQYPNNYQYTKSAMTSATQLRNYLGFIRNKKGAA